jgi:amino acid efflux transporter
MTQHKISLTTAILMSLNIMIGSGILIGPGVMAGVAGNASFLTWLIVAALLFPVVYSTVQMARINPGPGGFYQYAKAGLNTTAGYISALLYLAGYTFVIAVEVLALRQTLGLSAYPILTNALIIGVLIGLNLLGLKFFSRILNSLTIWKMLPVVTLILLLPFIYNPSFSISPTELKMLPYSLPMAMFGYFGFEYACSISHLIENSKRNAPLAILLAFAITAVLYTLFTLGILNLMGPDELAKQGASAFAEFIPFPYLKSLLRFLIPLASSITIFAGAAGVLNITGVLSYTLAEHKLFKYSEFLTPLTSSHRPGVTIILSGLIAFVLASAIPSISIIGNICILGVLLSFVLPLVSLILLQYRSSNYFQVLISSSALILIIGLVVYSSIALGSDTRERLLHGAPLMAFLLCGALLYNRNN